LHMLQAQFFNATSTVPGGPRTVTGPIILV
jgi:hypothetical protein